LIYDAHNHLQDPRLSDQLDVILSACEREGISRMVVNGTREADWPRVLELSRKYPVVLPSFGCHPWYLSERTAGWRENLVRHLDAIPSALGEIGLDRWMKNPDIEMQEEMFRWQLRIATERNLPVTIHCLKAWGRIDQILREEPLPEKGFLLHSYSGSAEMVDGFVKLGGYFSISGYFAHERKVKQREVLKQVPPDRLLIETDAPDMSPPESRGGHPLIDPATARPLNHPANLRAVYEFAAELFERPVEQLAEQVGKNFRRLFGFP
jgi:TatD DNase family protein